MTNNTSRLAANGRTRNWGKLLSGELLLLAIAVAVIAFSCLAKSTSRQVIVVRGDRGSVTQYSLATDDPRLFKLRGVLERHELVARQQATRRDERVAKLGWQQELAEFYAENLSARPSPVRPVSFQSPAAESQSSSPVRKPAGSLRPEHERYWRQLAEHCRRSLMAHELSQSQASSQNSKAAFEIGELIEDRWRGQSWQTWASCGLCGLAGWLMFALWVAIAPALRLSSPKESGDRFEHPDAIRLEIPRRWVRLHQPPVVRIRQSVSVAVVVGAICCVLI